MSEKEFIHDDNEQSRKEVDNLKNELQKSRIEKITLENSIKSLEEKVQELGSLTKIKSKDLGYKIFEEKNKIMILRVKRIMTFAPLMLGMFIFLLPLNSINKVFPIEYKYLNVAAVLLILISMFSLMLWYLQTGFQGSIENKKSSFFKDTMKYDGEDYKNKNKDIDNGLRLYSSFKREMEGELNKLRSELIKSKNRYENESSDTEILSTENKNDIVDSLKAKLLDETSQLTALEILNKIKDKLSENDKSGKIDDVFNQTLERLKSETASLGRRGNLNLSLGIVTTIIGLSLLGFFVIDQKAMLEDKITFITDFFPRLSLVVLIEVFAYFFLRLYKSSLSEIKYFQNEMTNIEAKYAAIKCAKFADDKSAFSSVISALTTTERNALLEKGQTTTEIEMAKIENKNISVISEKVIDLIKNKKDVQ